MASPPPPPPPPQYETLSMYATIQAGAGIRWLLRAVIWHLVHTSQPGR